MFVALSAGLSKDGGLIEMRYKKVTVDGILFDSKTEADYYVFLRYQEKRGLFLILDATQGMS